MGTGSAAGVNGIRLIIGRACLSGLCIIAVGLLFYEWRRDNPRDIALIRLENEKLLILCIDPSYPPFASIQNDQVVGLDADIGREIGRRLGVNASFRVLGYDGLYDALKVGECDALISALSFDPSRLGDFRFTNLYFDAGAVIFSREGYQDMPALEGKRVSVEAGTLGDDAARTWSRRLHQLDKHSFETSAEALAALTAGGADAALVDMITARQYLRTHPDLKLTLPSVQPDPYVIAVRIQSRELLRMINEILDAMRTEGVLEQIIGRWV